jgi:type II secretory pathway pseudopilin PulG
MDEVKAMTHAGETVGRAVGTGLRTLRRGAVQAGQAGAEAAAQAAVAMEHKLADSGQEAVKELVKTTRKARRQLARNAQRTAKDAGKQARKGARKAGKNLQRTVGDLTERTQRRSRRWPWLLVGGVAAAGVVAVLRSRQDQPTEPESVQDDRTEQDRIAGNGTAPTPRQEQKQPNSQLKS